jgi:hypothetical protein
MCVLEHGKAPDEAMKTIRQAEIFHAALFLRCGEVLWSLRPRDFDRKSRAINPGTVSGLA